MDATAETKPPHRAPSTILERDLERRSISGIYAYLIAWVVIGWVSESYASEPDYFWSVLTVLAVLGSLRLLSYLYSRQLLAGRPLLWNLLFGFNALAPALVFGLLLAMAMAHGDHDHHSDEFIYLLMAVFGLVSGGIVTFSPKLGLANAYLLLISVPSLFAVLFINPDHRDEGLLIFIFSLFSLVHIRLLNKEYLERVAQRDSLERLSQIDGLTDVYNRRYFDQALQLYWKSHLRSGESLGLLLIDIDHFKQVNDTHGHPAGDKVLKQVAATIKHSFRRDTDVVARIGGEEFAVLMSEPGEPVIEQLAHALNIQIARQSVRSDRANLQVTVSIGVALATPQLSISLQDFYKAADRCLYQAKEQGRDRVVSCQLSGP
ncbi:GGDEF domain-containing protein [Motiliproteus sp.]|uniref:GGDEF domain-containing protein n=1 Tax=Motiliproteus sp. TaxID=1898955 RepID=UPI003BAB0BCA